MVYLKSEKEIEKMYASGQLVREVLDRLGEIVAVGMTTADLDAEAQRIAHERGAACLFKGYPGPGGPFPGAICASVNEEVVHGIPSSRELQDGDIISVDFGILLDGWCGDSARTFCVGDVPAETRKLVDVTRHSLDMATALAQPGGRWSEVATAMSDYIRSQGFSVIEQYVGHGIGEEMHEEPQVPNYVSPELRRRDILLEPGLVLAIEPMVNMGTKRCRTLRDGWTVVTADGKPSAHWEHTIAITETGVRVLTA
ncbi:MAG: type I methionyl aminopeptidase [Phycisphaerales bacterium]|jgi:methionyl aminopeptidase|nr:type I methionyl aminopeptidase [Phycisphaerales bacterium]MBT7171587.1 type I methionyl aminopeptidase [Phycisphaerales bacterium]